MADDWSRVEVEATVADYNKSEHRRRLSAFLNHRTDGAIERKHQNVSAILIELGFVYISGYKPLRNYQQLLWEVVSDRLARSENLVQVVRAQVTEPAAVPTVENILAALVEPPMPDLDARRYQASQVRERPPGRRSVDYLAMEARNRSLGGAGEEFVLRFEAARLIHAGKERLAAKVERVSETRGDALGFDVLSFEISGEERFIEVKTTAYGSLTPFFVSKNEVAVSRESNDSYHLYRAFHFRRQPRLFMKRGPLDQSFRLEPSQFVAIIG
jgi:hypothetical protein